MIKVALIGLGVMGKNHLRNLYDLHLDKKIKFNYACDLNKYQSLNIDSRYEDEVYITNNYNSFINNSHNYDLVVIATSTNSHYQICKDLIERKVNVLVEKPICTNYDEAIELYNLARQNNVKLFVGHIERFNRCIQILQSKLDLIGQITSFNFTRIGMARQSFDTGILLDLGIHDFDLVNNLIGTHYKFHTICEYNKDNIDISSISVFKFSSGILGTVQNSYDTTFKLRTIQINGTIASLHADLVNNRLYLNESKAIVEFNIPKIEPLKSELLYCIEFIEKDIDFDSSYALLALKKVNLAMNGGDLI